MRYLLITYNEQQHPYLFDDLSDYCRTGDIDCALSEFSQDQSVVEFIQQEFISEKAP